MRPPPGRAPTRACAPPCGHAPEGGRFPAAKNRSKTPAKQGNSMSRLTFFVSALAGLVLAVMPQGNAAEWPTKPIRLVVPSSAGGAADLMGRTFATALATALGQQFVIDNRPGAG